MGREKGYASEQRWRLDQQIGLDQRPIQVDDQYGFGRLSPALLNVGHIETI